MGILLVLAALALAAPGAVAVPATPGVGPSSNDGVRWISGGWRFEVGGEVTWAEDGFVQSIRAYTQIPGGWMFVDGDGILATSATFTGPLVRVDGLGARVVESTEGNGRITIRDAMDRWWWTDGGPFRRVSGLPEPVLSAAFLDTTRGAVVTQGGALWTTEDGGAGWTEHPVGDDAALSVKLEAGALVAVQMSLTRRTLFAGDGSWRPVGGVSGEAGVAAGEGLRLRAIPEPDPAPWMTRADGAMWKVGGKTVLRWDPAGKPLESVEIPAPEGAWCRYLLPWGGQVAAIFSDGTLAVTPDGGAWRLLKTFPVMPEGDGYAFGDDGLSAAVIGPCEGAPYESPALCVTSDGGSAWRTIRIAHESPKFRGISDGRALVWGTRQDLLDGLVLPEGASREQVAAAVDALWEALGTWAVVDLPTGAVTALATRDPLPVGARVLSTGLLPEGAAFAVIAGEPLRVAIGDPGDLVLRDAPDGAISAGFASKKEGYASGSDASALWKTRNGGASWKPVEVALDGHPALLPLREGTIRCEDGTCTGGSRAILRFGDVPFPVRALGRIVPEEPAPQAPPPEKPALQFQCAEGGPVPVERLLPAAPGADRQRVRGADLEAAVDIAQEGEILRATVRWMDGDVPRASVPLEIPWPGHFNLLASSGKGVLVEHKGSSSSWWWAVDGRPPVVFTPKYFDHAGPWVSDPDGGVWLTVPPSHGMEGWQAEAIHFPADGSPPRRVTRRSERGETGWIVGWDGGPVVTRPAGSSPSFEAIRLDRMEVLSLGAGGDLEICEGPPSGRSVYVPAGLDGAGGLRDTVALLDLTPDGACVREVRRSSLGWDLAARAEGGRLVGRQQLREGLLPITCDLIAP